MTDWKEHKNSLEKTFTFTSFPEALAFVVEVGSIAEKLHHHPDIHISYTTVTLATKTHDAGSVVTDKDRALAAAIDALV